MFSILRASLLALSAPLLLLSVVDSPAQAPVPVFSVRISPKDDGSALRRDIVSKVKSSLGKHWWSEYAQSIERIDLEEYARPEGEKQAIRTAVIQFADATPAKVVAHLQEKQGGTSDPVDGVPAIKFSDPSGKCECWVAQRGERQLVVASSRSAMHLALQQSPSEPTDPTELLAVSGDVHGISRDACPAQRPSPKDMILEQFGKHVALSVTAQDKFVRIASSVELHDDSSANRLRKMIEGVIAALAEASPNRDTKPLDERLQISTEGNELNASLDLTGDEINRWIVSIQEGLRKRADKAK
jgi:hypothetical protein